MRKVSLVVLFASLAWGTQPTAAVDLITETGIKADMYLLANDDMKGRDATSPEGRIAADYVASEFMRLGLKPVGNNGTYFQEFDMVLGPLDRAHTTLKATLGGREKTFQMGHDFSYFFVQSANPTDATAPLVFARIRCQCSRIPIQRLCRHGCAWQSGSGAGPRTAAQ